MIPGGYPWEFFGWDVLPGSPNSDSISGQKIIFYIRFQTWQLRSILVSDVEVMKRGVHVNIQSNYVIIT